MEKSIIYLFLCFSLSSHAGWKDKARSMTLKWLGEGTANSLFGEEIQAGKRPQIPTLPQVSPKGYDGEVYNKNKAIFNQGKVFSNKSDVEKRKYWSAYISELFLATRGSAPNENEVIQWLNVLNQGGSREGVYRAVVNDEVYSILEGHDYKLDAQAREIVKNLMNDYLGYVYNDDTLAAVNLYRLKKDLTDRMLNVGDAFIFENRSEDFYTWYAIWASDLAKTFAGAWKNKMRQSSRVEAHLKWAKEVPLQHIKSEIILRTHMVLNYLNNR